MVTLKLIELFYPIKFSESTKFDNDCGRENEYYICLNPFNRPRI